MINDKLKESRLCAPSFDVENFSKQNISTFSMSRSVYSVIPCVELQAIANLFDVFCKQQVVLY